MNLFKNTAFSLLVITYTLPTAIASVELSNKNFSVVEQKELDTQLIIAIEKGDTHAVSTLVTAGANVNTKNRAGYTALMLATKKDSVDIVKYLITAGADVNVVSWVDNSSRDFDDTTSTTALMLAASSGNIEIVKALVTAKADINFKNKYGITAIMCAEKNIEILKYLIMAAESNLDKKSINNALYSAAHQGLTETVSAILTADIDVTAKNNALIEAKNTEIVKILIDAGADVNARDNFKATPLIKAAAKNNPTMVLTLIAAGAEVNAADHKGHTALIEAACRGATQISEILIDMDADINAKTQQGYTALQLAEMNRYTDIVKAIKKGKTTGFENLISGWRLTIWLMKMGLYF